LLRYLVGYADFCHLIQKDSVKKLLTHTHSKRCSCYARNLWVCWTNLDHTCTRCIYNIAIDYFWIETAIFFYKRQPAEWKSFCQFCPKLVAMTTSREELEKRCPDRLSMNKHLSFGAKIAKISPVDPEIIFVWVIIKKEREEEINASKIYSSIG